MPGKAAQQSFVVRKIWVQIPAFTFPLGKFSHLSNGDVSNIYFTGLL